MASFLNNSNVEVNNSKTEIRNKKKDDVHKAKVINKKFFVSKLKYITNILFLI